MRYLMPLLALLSCNPEQGLAPIPANLGEPIEGPRPVELGPAPPEVYMVEVTELHEQEETVTDVDIYVLIDQSCSMSIADDQAVGAALQLIVTDVEGSMSPSGHWTVTFGTTSTVQEGVLPTFSRPADPVDLPAILSDIYVASSGLVGRTRETGFAAAYHLLDTGLVPDTTDNKLYIIVSDEDDQSYPPDLTLYHAEGPYDWDGDGLIDGASNFWDPVEFSAWAMAKPSTDLLYITPPDYWGRRYQAAAAIHGRHIDFDSAWGGALSTLAWATILNDTYVLGHPPIAGSVEVRIDGVRTWDWALVGQTLTLGNPPGIGIEVAITYRYWTL